MNFYKEVDKIRSSLDNILHPIQKLALDIKELKVKDEVSCGIFWVINGRLFLNYREVLKTPSDQLNRMLFDIILRDEENLHRLYNMFIGMLNRLGYDIKEATE